MASKKPLPDPAPQPIATAEDFPVVETVGMVKTPKGYVVVLIKTQGRKVIDEEILSNGPLPRAHAWGILRVETVKRFLPVGS